MANEQTTLASGNLALKFALELAALALFAYWGASTGSAPWPAVLAVAAPTAMIAVWATWAAPRSPRRLPTPARIPLELGVFAIATAAGWAAGAVTLSIAFACCALLNAVGLSLLHQWDG
jgi:hypothetical protein